MDLLRCSVLQRVSIDVLTMTFVNPLQCVAVCCSVLQCVSIDVLTMTFVNPLQCVAVCCSVLQRVSIDVLAMTRYIYESIAVCCSVLQCAAVRCSVLQCVAVCCSVYADRKDPSPRGGSYFLCSLIKNPEKEDTLRTICDRCFEGGPLPPGS